MPVATRVADKDRMAMKYLEADYIFERVWGRASVHVKYGVGYKCSVRVWSSVLDKMARGACRRRIYNRVTRHSP